MSKSKINLLSWMCVLFYSSFVCISAYANVYFQTIFNQHSCVRGPLRECRSIRSGASGLPYYCAPLVCVSEVIELLAVCQHNKPKTKTLSSVIRLGLRNPRKKGRKVKKEDTAPVPTSCPCCFVVSCAFVWSRSLSFLSLLVRDLLPRRLFHGFR